VEKEGRRWRRRKEEEEEEEKKERERGTMECRNAGRNSEMKGEMKEGMNGVS